MKQKIIKFVILSLIIAVSVFAGHKFTVHKNDLTKLYGKIWKISERYYFFTLV